MNAWLPIIGSILALASSAFVAILAYRHGMKGNVIAEQAGIATREGDSISQVIAGQNSLIDNLQAEIARIREEVKEIRARLDDPETGNLALMRKNLELERENRILHAENDDFKIQLSEQAAEISEQAAKISEQAERIAELEKQR